MDAAEFKRTSHAVWESMAPGWDARHAYFEQTARAVSERMLERLAPRPGQTVLELAAGTGTLGFAAAAAVGSNGRVIVSDFSAAMVEAARRHAAALGVRNVECRVLDAERLDLPDGEVDGVLCRWGYMLMADPAAALAETRRVVRRGGRVSCAVFGAGDANPWVALPSRVLQERGHLPQAGTGGPGILALGDEDRLRALLTTAGFDDLAIDRVQFSFRFADADDYAGFLTGVAGAIAMVLDGLGDDERGGVLSQIAARLSPHDTGAGIELPAECLVAAAVAT
jgi:ubiquinone/menaquinone biosynthesis C-methylase UbiE